MNISAGRSADGEPFRVILTPETQAEMHQVRLLAAQMKSQQVAHDLREPRFDWDKVKLQFLVVDQPNEHQAD